ncbi:MAG: hypothetical protein ABFD58_01020 [Anaerolineaceae bacterium]
MLNLPVTMIKSISTFLVLCTIFLSNAGFLAFQQPDVEAPSPGDVLKGLVEIKGTATGEEFASYDVAFTYAEDTTGTWFIIQSSEQPVEKGVLALWDTTVIADGIYRLRVQQYSSTGEVETILIENLRIRNYSPVETKVPHPTEENSFVEATAEITSTPVIEVTPLTANPAEISMKSFWRTVITGISITAALFLFLGGRATMKNRKRNR